ncbi:MULTISPECIES: hypothetical protein [unclassified Cryobacterium]|uniref:hypothetical protein n=1 Tax=unclassified Cryobacterium TaxID=2649013 RepID=UPI00106C1CF4|nr:MULTISPECIES: hypothetical protein [unclassified Cryobacterium]TFC59427.1 hypothetical protein E3O68_00575 [Cryobacterium sp. TMB3-1-2]TFC67223.1 hypothetical protein E3T21_17270 [Cryobacterium sp. TMB3-15]TFC73264.1 hypothetical protein E3T22_16785 [Cryobacterium sp. TMB3-10]TFD46152.1 hypothetical protein E3T58_01420 [Cryobacterium sp. TMB3-12]
MPKEQINTPARRTISYPTGRNGLEPGQWGSCFTRDGEPLGEGEHWENTPVLYLHWNNLGMEPSLQFSLEVDADEVLRAADQIRASRLEEIPDTELPEGAVRAIVTYAQTVTFDTVVISRPEAQKLIATTRRARNAVFGGDE